MDFRVLPEYIIEDIVDYLFFAVQCVLLAHLVRFSIHCLTIEHHPKNSNWRANWSS